MNEQQFIERVAETCGRTVLYWDEGSFALQDHPNPYNIQLKFRDFGPAERYADIYIPKTDRWLLLFWDERPQFSDHPGCCYHLQENTDTDGPEGIVDHKFSKTLAGCLNTLEKLLKE